MEIVDSLLTNHVAIPLWKNQSIKIRTLFAAFLVCLSPATAFSDDNWPQFRGHGGLGIGSGHPPTEWNTETDHNVAWKTPIPGLGHSSPIVCGNRIFLTTAVNSDAEIPSVETGWSGGAGESASDTGEWTWQVMCLQLETGKQL